MSAPGNKITSTSLASCDTLADVDGKRDAEEQEEKVALNRKLEAIERQLHYLIGKVRELKTT